MPKISDTPMHRIHIRLEMSDYEWLKKTLGGEQLIAKVLRDYVHELHLNYERRQALPRPSVKELLNGEIGPTP